MHYGGSGMLTTALWYSEDGDHGVKNSDDSIICITNFYSGRINELAVENTQLKFCKEKNTLLDKLVMQ